MLNNSNSWLTRRLALILLLLFTMTFVSPLVICATSLDELQQQSQQAQAGSQSQVVVENGVYQVEEGGPHYYQGQEPSGYSQTPNAVESQSTNALSDYMRGYTPVTEENMQFASQTMSPVVKVIGNITGCIMVFTVAAIFLVTALDLCYIGVPFTRAFLNPQYASGVQAGGMPMGGMGMGMRGYGGMGGMGMGGAGPQQNMPESGLRRKWVSDEAVTIVAQYAAQPMGQNSAMGMGGGMMGGMGMGGMMGGGMMGAGQMPPQPTKIVIFEYFKRRMIFLVIFAVASTLLLSSVFTDCGLNIAELGVKLMNKLNGKITEVNI